MADDTQKDPTKNILDMREMGASGLKRFGGFIYEEFLKELTGAKSVEIFKEMGNNDPVVTAILFAITMLIRKVQWRVDPASNSKPDLDAALFLESCMDDMSQTWADTIAEILSMLQYGYSLHEIVYKKRVGPDEEDASLRSKYTDGRIGWRRIPIRSQDSIFQWIFDGNGGIQGAQQLAPPHYRLTTIPIEKALLFRTTVSKNNPEGKSILRGAYRPWYMKKNIENIEAVGIERDLAGLPYALVPPEMLSVNASPDEKMTLAKIQEIVRNIRRDEQEGVIFPLAYNTEGKEIFKFGLMSAGGQRQFDTDKVIQRYDQRIAMTCLADFILLGHEKVGSFALSSSKTSIFSMAVSAYLDIIADVFNRYAVPRLFNYNPDLKCSTLPMLVHDEMESVDLNELGNYIQKLSMSGFPLFPNPDLEKQLLKVAHLPLPAEEKRVTRARPQPQASQKPIAVIPADTPVDQDPVQLRSDQETTP